MKEFRSTRARLLQEVEEGLFTPGVQVVVERHGERVFDEAIGDNGLGAALTPATLFRVYCAIKPVTTLAVAKLVDTGVLTLDEPIARRLPDIPAVANGTTLRHVLGHTAGLHVPAGVDAEMLTADARHALVATLRVPPGWRIGRDAGYSEYVGWEVLRRLVEQATRSPLREHLRDALLDPLGLTDTYVGMTAPQYEAARDRIGVNRDVRKLASFPMLYERSERVCCDCNPAYNGYTTARDLARLYSAVLAGLRGDGSDALPSASTLRAFCTPARDKVYDEVLGRECAFGLGFMTPLADHEFGAGWSSQAFGHSGNIGASFAFGDPADSLAVAVVYGGIVDHETAFLRRRALLRALRRDLDESRGG